MAPCWYSAAALAPASRNGHSWLWAYALESATHPSQLSIVMITEARGGPTPDAAGQPARPKRLMA